MFPLQYDVRSFSEDGSGTDVIYTTTYKCIVYVFSEDLDWDSTFEFVEVFADPPSGKDSDRMLFAAGASNTTYADRRFSYPTILESGVDISVFRAGESIDGELHLFRLPESEN